MNDNRGRPGSESPLFLIERSLTSRRQFLRVVGGSGLLIVGGGFLAACGGGSGSGSTGATTDASSTVAAGTPKRGGTLRFGGQGGADTDTLDAHNCLTNTDFARQAQLYDPLIDTDYQGNVRYRLATSVDPNADASEWTIKLRPGVVCHDGKPFGAKDVLFTFDRIFKNKFPAAASLGPMNIGASKVVDDQTLVVKFDQPFGLFKKFLELYWYMYMVPEGYDPKTAVGTGAFKFKSFTPGVESTFVRNENYWDEGRPYLDEVVTTNIADETAQLSGLQSGQLDAVNYLSAASIATLQGNSDITTIISEGGGWGPFTMSCNMAPFDDVQVRQAFRLIIDRQQMIDQVFAGKGKLGNDMFGLFDPDFDTSIPQRTQDLEQAKSLLKAAGKENLSVELFTTANAPGMVEAAQVFATQAKGAGVNVKVTNQPVTTYFANSYLKVPFSQDYWQGFNYLLTASQGTVTEAPFQVTHFSDPEYDALYATALASADEAVHKDAIHGMQKIDYERGGFIIPYFFPVVDATSSKVKGVLPGPAGIALNGFSFRDFWME
ncbi:MAG: peptide/nickel transport system substrate-binding protein [Chloroflexota bacterium]|nr:peptide/nickel transport system substrate-binding protein [Chloroflexota bacterium]